MGTNRFSGLYRFSGLFGGDGQSPLSRYITVLSLPFEFLKVVRFSFPLLFYLRPQNTLAAAGRL